MLTQTRDGHPGGRNTIRLTVHMRSGHIGHRGGSHSSARTLDPAPGGPACLLRAGVLQPGGAALAAALSQPQSTQDTKRELAERQRKREREAERERERERERDLAGSPELR